MDRLNLKLLSMVLLGALLLMMVHNIMPHTHHDHGDSEVLHEGTLHHHHAHENSHKHSDSENSEEESEDGFPYLFFAHHSHSGTTNDFILLAQLEHTFPNKSYSFPKSYLNSSARGLIYFREQIGTYQMGHDRLYEYTFVPSSSSRAPPYLG